MFFIIKRRKPENGKREKSINQKMQKACFSNIKYYTPAFCGS